jgi:hypothetical protein
MGPDLMEAKTLAGSFSSSNNIPISSTTRCSGLGLCSLGLGGRQIAVTLPLLFSTAIPMISPLELIVLEYYGVDDTDAAGDTSAQNAIARFVKK